jgi:hypothetical protein
LATLSFIRFKERRKVVLPDPVGPMRAVMAPRGMPRLRPPRTVAEPKPRLRSRASMVAGRTSAPTTTGSSVAAIVGLKKELIDLRGRTGAGKISQHGNFRGIN